MNPGEIKLTDTRSVIADIPEVIVFCEFYDECIYAELNIVCLSGGGKYCGKYRRLKETRPKQRTLGLKKYCN